MTANPRDDAPVRADLHTHTTASDGLLSPAALVQLASGRGISILSITDHDSIAGLEEAGHAAVSENIRLIPGVELSTRAHYGQTHVLGYGIDTRDAALIDELAALRASRRQRGRAILERLCALGLDVERDEQAGDERSSQGRPHIARALVTAGHADSVADAFDRYLAVGRPAFVPRRTLTAERAIELIREAGGIAVLAHPLSVHCLDSRLAELVAAGLEGLEAHYGEYDVDQRSELVGLARSSDLLVTGGSDFHGESAGEGRELGSADWPQADVDAFLSRLG